MTQLFHLDSQNIDPTAIQTAAVALREGQTVAFPTETVYGLGGNALDPQAVQCIFAAKGRPSDNPLIVHIASTDNLSDIVSSVPPVAEQLMNHFWPGPLTLVLPRAAAIPDAVTAGLDTVAVRMPDHPVALALIAAAGVPVAAPSANRSGRPSPTRAEHVVEDLWGKIEVILDAGPCSVGVESTVLDVTCDPPMILRPGGVTKEMIEDALGVTIAVDPAIVAQRQHESTSPQVYMSTGGDKSHEGDAGAAEQRPYTYPDAPSVDRSSDPQRGARGEGRETPFYPLGTWDSGLGTHAQDFAPRSPGMKYTHYAPQAPMTLYVGPRDAVVRVMAELAAAETEAGRKVGVMLTSPVAFMPGELVIQLAESLVPSPSSLVGNNQAELSHRQDTTPSCRGAAMQRPQCFSDHRGGSEARPRSPSTSPRLFESGTRDEGLGSRDSTAMPSCGPSCWLQRNPHLDWLQTNTSHTPDTYSPQELHSIANGIYDALRRFDEVGVDLILAQGVPEVGLGQAIMNRLSKAAGGNVIQVN